MLLCIANLTIQVLRIMHILIIESSILLMERIEESLTCERKFTTVHKATEYQEGLNCIRKFQPDFILLDSELPDKRAMHILKNVLEHYPLTKVLVLSNHSDTYLKNKWIKKGATDCFDKFHELDRIREIIKC